MPKTCIGIRAQINQRHQGRTRKSLYFSTSFSHLAGASIVGLICLPVATPSLAACVPDPPSSGQTVTCTGNPSSFTSIGLTELNVDILTGTNFNGPINISLTGLLNVTNAGNINGLITLANNKEFTFENFGTENQGMAVSGNGVYTVINHQNAFI